MGFTINTKRDPVFRNTLTARDRTYVRNCETCKHTALCGGFSIWNDGRWCEGPGGVCFDDCRAICSRSPEKVDYYAQLLGEEYYSIGSVDEATGIGNAVPDLNIRGEHPWEPWTFEWPDVGFQLNAHTGGIYQPLYTVSMKHLFYWKRNTWSPQFDLRARFQIPESSRLAITTTCHDQLMDMLEYDMEFFVDSVSKYEGVDFIFAPNFSVYDNYPRLDNLFRIKFKWIGLDMLQKCGMRVVPDICFKTSLDFLNQVAWMRDNHVTMMLCNFQVQAVTTETREWEAQVRAAMAVQDALGYPVQLIAYGGVGGERMVSIIAKYGHNVTFIDAKSYRLAEFHKDIDGAVDRETPVKDLFHRNCHARRKQIARLKEREPTPLLDFEDALRIG